MNINLSFDASVSSAPAGFTADLIAAANQLAADIGGSNTTTVNIAVGWGEVGGMALSGAVAESDPIMDSTVYTYDQVALMSDASGNGVPIGWDPTNQAGYQLTLAQAKALGFLNPGGAELDGYIGFDSTQQWNTSTVPGSRWDGGNDYDLMGAAQHEISEVMGRLIGGAPGGGYNTDLNNFDYSGPNALAFGLGGWFSTNQGNTLIKQFDSLTGRDPGDWEPTTGLSGIDPFNNIAFPGEEYDLSATDVQEMQALGYASGETPYIARVGDGQAYTAAASQVVVGTPDAGGSDTIYGASGDWIVGGAGNDTIGGAPNSYIMGGEGHEFLDGTAGGDYIVGGNSGTDLIYSAANDTIVGGGTANETIGGVAGNLIYGGLGTEFIDASAGSQTVYGGQGGNETIWGGTYDTIQAEGGNELVGGVKFDTLIGGWGTIDLSGWLGNQLVEGGSGGNDTLTGGPNDTIYGGASTDFIDATAGSQGIYEGSGAETIWGGASDTVSGGTGSVLVGLGSSNPNQTLDPIASGQHDTVSGFSQANGDRIHLPSGVNESTVIATATVSGGNMTLTWASGSTTVLQGVTSIDGSYFA